MYEIIDGKVVKREVTENIIPVSSENIRAEITSIEDAIKNLNKRSSELSIDLAEVLKLETQLKK